MSSTAMIFMIFAMVMIWGGLIAATIHLMKNPDKSMEELGFEE